MSRKEVHFHNRFAPVQRIIDLSARLSGCFIYGDQENSPTWKFLAIASNVNFFLAVFEAFVFTFYNPKTIVSFVYDLFILMILQAGLIVVHLNYSNFGIRKNVIEWCKNLYQHRNRTVRNIYRGIFGIARSYSLFISKFLVCLFIFVHIFTHFGIIIFCYFYLREKYALPANFYLPFLPPTTWYFYLVNEIHQFFAFASLVVHLFASVILFFIVMLHFLVDLKAIERLIQSMPTFVKSGKYDTWIRLLAIEIESLKTIVHPYMLITRSFLGYVEKLFYASFVILWLAVKIEPELLPLWLVSNSVIGLLFISVCLNEILIQRFFELSYTLYNQNWFELKPSERRELIPLMRAFQRPIILTTGTSTLTLEWFMNTGRIAYYIGLMLENMAKK